MKTPSAGQQCEEDTADDRPCEYSAQLQYVKYHADGTNPDQSM